MAQAFDSILADLADFIRAQSMFFVATAPRSATARINLSPKGLDTFRVLSPNRVVYLDLTGSGNETAAHLLDDGRITFMFCAFDGPPKILRLYGTARIVLPADAECTGLISLFSNFPGIRQIVVAEINRVQTSCGFGIPVLKLAEQRDTLTKWAERKGPQGLEEYRAKKNGRSIDDLPAPGFPK